MGENKYPPGYIPLTIHELGGAQSKSSGGRAPSARSGGQRTPRERNGNEFRSSGDYGARSGNGDHGNFEPRSGGGEGGAGPRSGHRSGERRGRGGPRSDRFDRSGGRPPREGGFREGGRESAPRDGNVRDTQNENPGRGRNGSRNDDDLEMTEEEL